MWNISVSDYEPAASSMLGAHPDFNEAPAKVAPPAGVRPRMRPRNALLAFGLLLAGCASFDTTTGPDASAAEGDQAPADVAEILRGNASGVRAEGYTLAPFGDHVFDLKVAANVTTLVVEVAWEGDAPLEIVLTEPVEDCEESPIWSGLNDCEEFIDDEGSSPARIEIDATRLGKRGTWTLGVWARASAEEVPFEARVMRGTAVLAKE